MTPWREGLTQVQATLETIEERVEEMALHDATAQRLMTAPETAFTRKGPARAVAA